MAMQGFNWYLPFLLTGRGSQIELPGRLFTRVTEPICNYHKTRRTEFLLLLLSNAIRWVGVPPLTALNQTPEL